MGAQQSQLTKDAETLRQCAENSAGYRQWCVNRHGSKPAEKDVKVEELRPKPTASDLLAVAKVAETLRASCSCSPVRSKETSEPEEQERSASCRLAAALLSWFYRSVKTIPGIPFSRWPEATNKLMDIVDGKTARGKDRKETTARRKQQREAFEQAIDMPGNAVQNIRAAILQSSCYICAPGTCTGTCSEPAADKLAALNWVYSALGCKVPVGHPAAAAAQNDVSQPAAAVQAPLQQAVDDSAGTQADAVPQEAEKLGCSEQGIVGAPQAAVMPANPDLDSTAAGGRCPAKSHSRGAPQESGPSKQHQDRSADTNRQQQQRQHAGRPKQRQQEADAGKHGPREAGVCQQQEQQEAAVSEVQEQLEGGVGSQQDQYKAESSKWQHLQQACGSKQPGAGSSINQQEQNDDDVKMKQAGYAGDDSKQQEGPDAGTSRGQEQDEAGNSKQQRQQEAGTSVQQEGGSSKHQEQQQGPAPRECKDIPADLAAAAADAEADPTAAVVAPVVSQQELEMEAVCSGRATILRTIIQMLGHKTKSTRDRAVAACQEHLDGLFAGLDGGASRIDLERQLQWWREDTETLVELATKTSFMGDAVYRSFLRCLRNLTGSYYMPGRSSFGPVKEVLGAGGFGRVLSMQNILTGEEVAVKQMVLNVYSSEVTAKQKQAIPPLKGDFADVNATNPCDAAKEFLVLHQVASIAPASVAKPCGAWIHEEEDNGMKAVIFSVAMPRGQDLYAVKKAVVCGHGESEFEQFIRLPRSWSWRV